MTREAAVAPGPRTATPAELAPTLPGWTLRLLFAALAAAIALGSGAGAPWPEIAVALALVAAAVPRWLAAWVLIGVLAFSVLLEPSPSPARVLLLVLAAHVLHVLAAWTLVIPARARFQPAILLPGLRRLVLVQVPVQLAAAGVLALVNGRPPGLPALAVVAGVAVVALVVLLARPLLRRPR